MPRDEEAAARPRLPHRHELAVRLLRCGEEIVPAHRHAGVGRCPPVRVEGHIRVSGKRKHLVRRAIRHGERHRLQAQRQRAAASRCRELEVESLRPFHEIVCSRDDENLLGGLPRCEADRAKCRCVILARLRRAVFRVIVNRHSTEAASRAIHRHRGKPLEDEIAKVASERKAFRHRRRVIRRNRHRRVGRAGELRAARRIRE